MEASSTRVVQFTLMGALLGVALPVAIGSVATKPSWPTIALCTGYVLQALNFFHGKVATLEDEDYIRALTAQPRLALLDYSLNLFIVVTQVIIAFLFGFPVLLAGANVAMRLLDFILVLQARRVSLSELVRRAQTSWAVFDAVSATVWSLVLVRATLVEDQRQAIELVGYSFLLIVVADVVMDYTYNRDLYFTSPVSWEDFALLWDELQNELGDEYRRAIIGPALDNLLHEHPPERLLDFGCGNGCMSRWCAKSARQIVGVDTSRTMLRLASTYQNSSNVSFHLSTQHALPVELQAVQFDCFLSCFSHQDLGDYNLDSLFQLAAGHLTEGGRLIVIAEDLDSLEDGFPHTSTTRRWLDSGRRPDGSRRQLVYWFTNEPSTRPQLPTVTTIYSEESYLRMAEKCGFCLEKSKILRCPLPGTPTLRRYELHPRFRLMVFLRKT